MPTGQRCQRQINRVELKRRSSRARSNVRSDSAAGNGDKRLVCGCWFAAGGQGSGARDAQTPSPALAAAAGLLRSGDAQHARRAHSRGYPQPTSPTGCAARAQGSPQRGGLRRREHGRAVGASAASPRCAGHRHYRGLRPATPRRPSKARRSAPAGVFKFNHRASGSVQRGVRDPDRHTPKMPSARPDADGGLSLTLRLGKPRIAPGDGLAHAALAGNVHERALVG